MADKTATAAVAPTRRVSKQLRSNLVTYGIVLAFFVLMTALQAAGVLTNSLAGQLIPICAYACMAVSLNLVVGISGELSLGHAGFMSVGAFSGIVAFSLVGGIAGNGMVAYVLALVVAAAIAAIAGFVVGVPVMRLHGDYLAIVTLAFGEIIKNILNNLYVGLDKSGLHFSMTSSQDLGMQSGALLINGPQGAAGISKMSTFLVGIVLVIVTITVVLNLMHSRSGRAIMAVRDNRIAAESVGINVTKYRLMAFVVAAALAGAAGAFYAMGYSSIVPKKFDFNTSILILVFVVLGGMGNIRGSIISAAVLTVLPELLRAIADWRMLIYAIVLILVMIVSNNATLKQFFAGILSRFKRPARVAEPEKGGDANGR
ncbi:branched-chain amino acid ABC transporter permease [uncultured Parolsenella sp.]|uniref:branched-chain amino acid ABC transporter permease n=1 Tax=uncultured Parolsenella sp. TaxID=2083008 RepID=UPI0025D7DAD9|nr:branched-chain amino acid ABC transporter permease [uncultured Parolsenella sp.]